MFNGSISLYLFMCIGDETSSKKKEITSPSINLDNENNSEITNGRV